MSPASLAAWEARLDANAADPCVADAVKTLAAVGRWKDGLDRARAAIKAGGASDLVLTALAKGAFEGGRPDRCLKVLDQLGPAETDPAGRFALRLDAVEAHLGHDAARAMATQRGDATAQAWLAEHLDTTAALRGTIPLDTYKRAELLMRAGAPERAMRVLRRLAVDHPDDEAIDELLARLAVTLDDHGMSGVLDGMPMPELPPELP